MLPLSENVDLKLVLVTVPLQTVAEHLASALVEARLAACVNIIPGLTSVYRWQEKICTEAELLLIIKTTSTSLKALENWIHQHHPYDIPEFIVLSSAHVSIAYLAWLQQQVG